MAVCSDGTAFVADSLNQGGVAVYPPRRKVPTRRLVAQQSEPAGSRSTQRATMRGIFFSTGSIGASPFPATTGWRHGREFGYYLFPQGAWSSSGRTISDLWGDIALGYVPYVVTLVIPTRAAGGIEIALVIVREQVRTVEAGLWCVRRAGGRTG